MQIIAGRQQREEKYGEKQKREKQQFVNSKQGSDKTRKKREEREVFYASVGVCLCVCVCVCACARAARACVYAAAGRLL